MAMACPYTIDVGCYLLGALDEQEHEQVRRHTAECASCQDEITALLPVIRGLHHTKAHQDAAGFEVGE